MAFTFQVLVLLLLGVALTVAQQLRSDSDERDLAGMVVATTGSTLFFTKHGDSACLSPPHGVSRDYYIDKTGTKQKSQINTCLQKSDVNFKLICKKGANDFTLTAYTYSKTDTTCANPLVSGGTKYSHDGLCFARNGIYLKARCGEDALLTSLLSKSAVVAPALFNNKYCSSLSGTLLRRYIWFDVCTPILSSSSGGRKAIKNNFKISLTTSSPLKVRMSTYSALDTGCSQRIRGQRDVVYAAVPPTTSSIPACVPDMLYPGFYYSNTQGMAPSSTTTTTATTTTTTTTTSTSTTDITTTLYMLTQEFSSSDCSGVPVFRSVGKMGLCVIPWDSVTQSLSTSVSYIQYLAGDGTTSITKNTQYYVDTTCTQKAPTGWDKDPTFFTTNGLKTSQLASSFFGSCNLNSMTGMYQSSTSPTTTDPSSPGYTNVFVTKYYASSASCSADTNVQQSMFFTFNACIITSSTASMKYILSGTTVGLIQYSNNACTGEGSTLPQTTATCTPNPSTGYRSSEAYSANYFVGP